MSIKVNVKGFKAAASGSLNEFARAQARAGRKAINSSLRWVSNGLKSDVRQQVRRARFKRGGAKGGTDPANTWRSQVQLKSDADNSTASVYTNWPAMLAFEKGATITGHTGKRWLAVPAQIGYIGNRRVRTKDLWHLAKQLVFVPTKDPNVAMLVHRVGGGRKDVVMFWLFRQVTVAKRLDFAGASERRADQFPARVVAQWEKLAAKEGVE